MKVIQAQNATIRPAWWIDLICIDQDNDGEHGHQGGMMRSIFEEAALVDDLYQTTAGQDVICCIRPLVLLRKMSPRKAVKTKSWSRYWLFVSIVQWPQPIPKGGTLMA
ncbi:hypothetical protein BU25DRAFT_415376 [Macroventuria anomochaeta]|uniref:Uncharacterized protein n=1 Tax=Macroventuria anomochaeta TaxID=301207 RepID=A0ACB6RKE5_9PLEO|nr:uncharacterized protein BU25DRAFT_415376 [Macroventuria anomochaeta]KAF2622213.1 hypothetical protein BU25DRAFT_415376 [Macroventuria anomochaeta]